jgi:threonylcarbamoyladenosine tRNA methylthiotransferase MtaB
MADAVPPAVIKERSRMLAELSRAKRMAFYQRHVGRTVDVLFETQDDAGRWTGFTSNYMRAGVTASGDLTNRLAPVMIEGAMDGLAMGRLA